jgi:SAM-dependent methyltransferase
MVHKEDMSYEILKHHREVWNKKRILREIYQDWYRLILENVVTNESTLEIGAGGGNFKEFFPAAISSDLMFCEWLDLSMDAHDLPFRPNSLGNIITIDALHHLKYPAVFLREAQRILRDHGRLIMLEPYISAFSYIIYKYFHQESVDSKMDVFCEKRTTGHQKRAFDGNSAVPTLLFSKQLDRFEQEFPQFKFIRKELLSFLAYPLSGGFDRESFVPESLLRSLNSLEKKLKPLGRILAFRILLVLEKNHNEDSDFVEERS